MSTRPSPRARNRGAPQAPSDPDLLHRLLDPIDALTQSIYSILIILTFTLAFRAFQFRLEAPPHLAYEQLNELLMAAAGGTLAWGLIDGLMYVLASMFERGARQAWLKQIQASATEQDGVDAVASELDYLLEPITSQPVRHRLYRTLLAHLKDSRPQPAGLKREDLAGALGTVLVTILAVLPSLAPLALIRHDATLAIRLSNIVSFGMLFVVGFRWARRMRGNPWKTGALLVLAGAVMVFVAIPLGG